MRWKNIYKRKVNTLRHVRPKAIGAKFQTKRYIVFVEAIVLFSLEQKNHRNVKYFAGNSF
jgi:hypothetical protein